MNVRQLVANQLAATPGASALSVARAVLKQHPDRVDEFALAYVRDVALARQREQDRKVEAAPVIEPTPTTPKPVVEYGVTLNPLGSKRYPTIDHGWVYNDRSLAFCEACGCDVCRKALDQERQARSKHWDDLNDAFKKFESSVRLQVTEELLATAFALGDGRRVTWGQATVEDHQTRIKLLEGNAVANLETAGRHQAAITMIEEAGVHTLSAVKVAA